MPSDTTNTPRRRKPPARRRGKRARKSNALLLRRVLPVLLLILALFVVFRAVRHFNTEVPSWVDVQLVHVNGTGRRGEAIERVHDIAVHYVGNPGTTAQQNRDFYDHADTQVSSHFVIGLKGEIIQCVPLGEKSSATNERNRDTISIEVCHPDETGKFTPETYDSLVRLTAWLCDNFDLSRGRVIRHYDVTGKLCPLYFVEHEEAWEQFLRDVKDCSP